MIKTGQSLTEMALVLSFLAAVFSALMLYGRRNFNVKYHQGINYLFEELKKEAVKQNKPELIKQFKQRQYETNYQEKETIEEVIKNIRTRGSSGSTVSAKIKNSGWTKIGPDRD